MKNAEFHDSDLNSTKKYALHAIIKAAKPTQISLIKICEIRGIQEQLEDPEIFYKLRASNAELKSVKRMQAISSVGRNQTCLNSYRDNISLQANQSTDWQVTALT